MKAKLSILKNVTASFLADSIIQFIFNLPAGLGYFLRRVLEDAIMVKILMKMLMVSMYIPIDLQKNTMFFHLSFGLDFYFQYQPFLMPTRVVLRPYSPKRELLLDWWWWGGWWERFSTECFKAESNHFKQSKLHRQSSESIKITQAIQCVNRNSKKKTTIHEARDEIVTIGFNIIPDSMKLVQISI